MNLFLLAVIPFLAHNYITHVAVSLQTFYNTYIYLIYIDAQKKTKHFYTDKNYH